MNKLHLMNIITYITSPSFYYIFFRSQVPGVGSKKIKKMASRSLGISELNFVDGNMAENWKRWKQTMRLTLQGPLAEKDEKQQCGYFLLYIGQQGRDIYNTWALKSAEKDKIEPLFERFEAYCNPQQNVTVLRYKFNTRVQRSDENIDQYVTELRRLAWDCSYGQLTDK